MISLGSSSENNQENNLFQAIIKIQKNIATSYVTEEMKTAEFIKRKKKNII